MKYLAVTGFRSEQELEAYLYAYTSIQDSGTTREGLNWAIVRVHSSNPAFHGQYQADRLASGMIGASVHDTEYLAALRILERV